MSDGEQQSFALLHDAFGFGLCLENTVSVASFASYVAQDVDNENGSRENGEKSENGNLYNHSPTLANSLVQSVLQGSVLVALNVLEQLLCAPSQLNAHKLQLVVAVGNYFLVFASGYLLVAAYFSQCVSHGVGDVQMMVYGVGLFRDVSHPYRVGVLSAEGIAQSSEESATAFHYFIHSLVLLAFFLGLRVYNHRVASALQSPHLVVVENVAVVLAQYRHYAQCVLAFVVEQVYKRVESLLL